MFFFFFFFVYNFLQKGKSLVHLCLPTRWSIVNPEQVVIGTFNLCCHLYHWLRSLLPFLAISETKNSLLLLLLLLVPSSHKLLYFLDVMVQSTTLGISRNPLQICKTFINYPKPFLILFYFIYLFSHFQLSFSGFVYYLILCIFFLFSSLFHSPFPAFPLGSNQLL